MTELYFAACSNPEVLKMSFGQWDWHNRPLNVLVAFPFINLWKKANPGWAIKATMLDSGAYSAWRSGEVIDLDALCEEAKDPQWNEAVALDVIGDAAGSLANSLKMKERGLEVMPVFHFGDPWEILQEYKQQFNRIGLSCRFGEPLVDSNRWTEQCFARAYPAKFHSFGYVAEDYLMRFPFATADTASWHAGVRYGRSNSMPDIRVPRKSEVGPAAFDLRFELNHYVQMGQRIKDRWRKELAWVVQPKSAPSDGVSLSSSDSKSSRSRKASSTSNSKPTK